MLGVPRDAGTDDLRWAYERELAAAARHGALRRAQEVDRAWSVLRDAGSRARYDRDGQVNRLPRLSPDERFVASRSVPFRAWSPAEGPPAPAYRGGCPPPSRSRRPLLVLLLLLTLLSLASWLRFASAELWPRGAGSETATTVEVACPASPAAPATTYVAPAAAAHTCPGGVQPTVRQLPSLPDPA